MKAKAGMVIGAVVVLLASGSVFADNKLKPRSSCTSDFGKALSACKHLPKSASPGLRSSYQTICVEDAVADLSTCANGGESTCQDHCSAVRDEDVGRDCTKPAIDAGNACPRDDDACYIRVIEKWKVCVAPFNRREADCISAC